MHERPVGDPGAATAGGPDQPSESRTFLIADIRGYTRYTDEHGDAAAAELAARFAGLVRDAVATRAGAVVEIRGDEVLAAFSSARQALRAAVDIQSRISEERLPRGAGIGLDSGEAVALESGYRGTALNVAARLCAQARTGEILASETVVRLAARVDGIRYSGTRTLRLKGLELPVRAVSVVAAGAPVASGPVSARTRARAIPSAGLALGGLGIALIAAAIWAAQPRGGSSGTAQPSPSAASSTGPTATGSPPVVVAPAIDVPAFRGGFARTNLMPGPGPDASAGTIEVRWHAMAGAEIRSPPSIAGDHVYLADRSGILHVLDLRTGAEQWTFDAGAPIAGTPTIASSTAFLVTDTGQLQAIDLGTHQRTWTLDGVSPGAIPVVERGLLMVGTAAGRLVAVSIVDGAQRWALAIGGDASMLAWRPGTVFVASSGRTLLHAVDTTAGTVRWQAELGGPPRLTPAISSSLLFALIEGPGGVPRLASLLADNGRETWAPWAPPDPAVIETLSVNDSFVYTTSATSEGTVIWAVDRFSGRLAWQRNLKGATVGATAVARDLFLSGADGSIREVGASDGDGIERWRVPIPERPVGDAVVTGGLVLVATGPTATDPAGISAIGVRSGPTASAAPDPWRWVADLTAGDKQQALYLNVALDADGKVYAADRVRSRIVIWDQSGKPEFWGGFGSDPGEFDFGGVTEGDQSQSVAIATDGRIAVGDGGNHRVQIFDADRRYIRSVGRAGSGPGQFVNPCCVAFDGKGRLYVADPGRNDIQIFDVDGSYVAVIGGPGKGEGQFARLGVPYIDSATGLLWVPDFSNDRVEVVDSRGTFVREYRVDAGGTTFRGVNGVVLDEAGRLFVVDDDRNNFLWVLDSDGTVEARLGPTIPDHGSIGPTYLALTSDGRLYIPDAVGSRVVVMQLLPPIWPPPL